jgi:hypothetical protein
VGADDELSGIEDGDPTQMLGIGFVGEVRQGPDGNLYQWTQGIDGLGNPVGFWSKLRRLAKRAANYIPAVAVARAAAPLLRRALPVAQQLSPFIPGGAAVLTAAAPVLKQAGIAGQDGLGALYQAPDGTLYQQVQGLAADEDLQGLAEDEDLRGFDADDELQGLAADEELQGFAADEDLQGFAEGEELRGVAADEDLQGLADDPDQTMAGYLRQDDMRGLEAYVPEPPPQTRWHAAPSQPPEIWKPLW